MDIFIGDFPEDVSAYSIRALLGVLGKEATFRIEPNLAADHPCCYCVVTLIPDSLGHKTVSQLAGARFQGKPLRVHEYVHRAHNNDRRAAEPATGYSGPERRRSERRAAL